MILFFFNFLDAEHAISTSDPEDKIVASYFESSLSIVNSFPRHLLVLNIIPREMEQGINHDDDNPIGST